MLLLDRSSRGVDVTTAGSTLYDEARAVLAHVEHARARVATAAGPSTLTVGSLAGAVEQTGSSFVSAFRERHPGVGVHVREFDFTDPSCGLRVGRADIAVTLAPFDTSGLGLRVLRTDPVAAVLRSDDPLADREALTTGDLDGRPWFRLPEGTDPVWSEYWTGGRDGPVVRTAHECLQAVLGNGSVGLVPSTHELPHGLTAVPLTDRPPCRLVLAWKEHTPDALVRSFVAIAAALAPGDGPRGGESPVCGTRN